MEKDRMLPYLQSKVPFEQGSIQKPRESSLIFQYSLLTYFVVTLCPLQKIEKVSPFPGFCTIRILLVMLHHQ